MNNIMTLLVLVHTRSPPVCVCKRDRASVCICVCVKGRESERVCVCVCTRSRGEVDGKRSGIREEGEGGTWVQRVLLLTALHDL